MPSESNIGAGLGAVWLGATVQKVVELLLTLPHRRKKEQIFFLGSPRSPNPTVNKEEQKLELSTTTHEFANHLKSNGIIPRLTLSHLLFTFSFQAVSDIFFETGTSPLLKRLHPTIPDFALNCNDSPGHARPRSYSTVPTPPAEPGTHFSETKRPERLSVMRQ